MKLPRSTYFIENGNSSSSRSVSGVLLPPRPPFSLNFAVKMVVSIRAVIRTPAGVLYGSFGIDQNIKFFTGFLSIQYLLLQYSPLVLEFPASQKMCMRKLHSVVHPTKNVLRQKYTNFLQRLPLGLVDGYRRPVVLETAFF